MVEPAPPVVITVPSDKAFESTYQHVWDWFALHSGQRMQMINYLMVALSLTTTAYAISTSQKKYGIACGIAIGGIVLSWLFQRLDARTRELIKTSEKALTHLESALFAATKAPVNFVTAIEEPAARYTTYRVTLRILTACTCISFGVAAIYAYVKSAA
jgi:hypothetical protein